MDRQPVDRTAEAWKLIMRRREWQAIIDLDEVVAVLLPSRSDEGAFWRVDLFDHSCGCPDFVHRQGPRSELCAHALAVAIAQILRRAGYSTSAMIEAAARQVAG